MNVTRILRYLAAIVCMLAGAYLLFFATIFLLFALIGGMAAIANGPVVITLASVVTGVAELTRFVGPMALAGAALFLVANLLLPRKTRPAFHDAIWRWLTGRSRFGLHSPRSPQE